MKNIFLLIVLLVVNCAAWAQKKRKKEEEKVPVYNYVIDDPMDQFGRQPVPAVVKTTALVPEFYGYGGQRFNDTVIRYECYDAHNNIILPDTLKDYQQLRYVSVLKRYNDPVNKYRDANGAMQPLPVEKIIRRYDKTGIDKWFYVDYTTNKSATLQEFPQEIVHRDTVTVIDPVTNTEHQTFYNEYKVAPVK